MHQFEEGLVTNMHSGCAASKLSWQPSRVTKMTSDITAIMDIVMHLVDEELATSMHSGCAASKL
jgi:hypothetical protein